MKKFSKILAVAAALVATIALASCSSNAADFGANESNDESRSAYFYKWFTLESDLNPGYGKAVYFAGNFVDGYNWERAIRGTYDTEKGKWVCSVLDQPDLISSEAITYSFEYKCLVGDYDLGETVELSFAGLELVEKWGSKVVTQDGKTYVAYPAEGVDFGKALYFKQYTDGIFDNGKSAVRGQFVRNFKLSDEETVDCWVAEANDRVYCGNVYVGNWSNGSVVKGSFANLTWAEGNNTQFTYSY